MKNPFFQSAGRRPRSEAGFTIMEVVVATTIFAFVMVAMTTLFNYTLKINRRAEVLRQATQGMRDFVEAIVKEVRNGQIDYGVISGQTVVSSALGQCDVRPAGTVFNGPTNGRSSYSPRENRLALLNTEGVRECFYLGDAAGNYVGSGIFSGSSLVLEKEGNIHQIMNPPNYTVDFLSFLIRPICDPYTTSCQDYGSGAPKIQPFVTIVAKFRVRLPTGEVTSIYYQTSVSGDKYDVPNTP